MFHILILSMNSLYIKLRLLFLRIGFRKIILPEFNFVPLFSLNIFLNVKLVMKHILRLVLPLAYQSLP